METFILGNIENTYPIVELYEHEKFIIDEGITADIEVRCVCGKYYFNAKDIQNAYQLNNLRRTIIDTCCDEYVQGIHYVFMHTTKVSKKLYLTYLGVLRVLFASRKETADKFLSWATKTLFTAQLGTNNQKTKLVSNLLGVSSSAVREVFNKNVSTIPCIYLFSIGRVKYLRNKLSIGSEFSDNDFVYKWGMSIDLERRTKEHQKTYSKLSKSEIELILYGFIDPQYVSEAETKIAHIFENFELKLNNPKYIELAVISSKKMRTVKESYDMISKAYMGHIKDIINKIKEKDNEIALLKEQHKNELMAEQHKTTEEKYKNELMAEQHKTTEERYKKELLQKEIEILNLKYGNKRKSEK